MPNRLAQETSPYLLQHANNPVDWYPWGPEALERAKAEDKPILLSIGYSACHWCHVMEHESFENDQIAALMNENFVNIKVDREERPDLDSIYMEAVQAISGHGGWPMTVFLTPEGKPFYGGTYYPPTDRGGMPGFPRVLLSIANVYRTRRQDVEQSVREILGRVGNSLEFRGSDDALQPAILDDAFRALAQQFDRRHGGFGGAPKFPQPMNLEFLLRTYLRIGDEGARLMAEQTLQAMASGGIYDQLGGGFHRYSVDAEWLVPHFEKMLYDNALLSRVYVQAAQVTGDPFYRRIAEETYEYVRREMTSPEGGFYSTQDADSEGEEGKFFVWKPEEIEAVLGPEAARIFNAFFDVTPRGNFEGHSILNVPRTLETVAREVGASEEKVREVVVAGRAKLFAEREKRVKPGRDEKILAAWNGLMLRSFAEAARAFDRDDYRRIAEANATFLLDKLSRDGRLLRTYKDGQSKLNAYLEDYAMVADGLLALYETTFDLRWFNEARRLVDIMLDQFWDEERGGFYDTSRDHESLISRPKDLFDNATPSGNSVAADVLLRLAALTGSPDYERSAVATIGLVAQAMSRYPTAFGRMLSALDFHLSSKREVAIVGDPDDASTRALLAVTRSAFAPNQVVALRRPDDWEPAGAIMILEDRPDIEGRPTAYVCENYACQAPVTEPADLARLLGVAAGDGA
ncbi:MAG TPA: thioredoxin domain-containing protein [Dehalococcoidia bacterium]|nr:thioredoxin domain-containing protein [Dehalococcoidia bacterium]